MVNGEIAALVEFLHSRHARMFSFKRSPSDHYIWHITLNSRTTENFEPIRRELVRIFGEPTRNGYKGRQIMETKFGQVGVLKSITAEHKPPDVVITLKGRHNTTFKEAMKVKATGVLRQELRGTRAMIPSLRVSTH